MKKFTLSALTVGGFILASCGGSAEKTYTITAQVPDASLDNTTVYLQNLTGDKLDSTVVVNGVIKFENTLGNPELVTLKPTRQLGASFILEPSEITVDFINNSVVGGDLNKARAEQNAKKEVINNQLKSSYEELVAKMADESLDQATKQELQSEFSSKLENTFQPQLKELDIAYLNANKNNILAVDALASLANAATEAELETLIGGLDPAIAQNAYVQKVQKDLEVTKKTAEGQMFTDFTIDQGDGTSLSLSDFVGKGKYVLVDFWASWCPPCRAEIPNLAEVYKTYKGDNFELISVAVWDKIDDSKKAIAELNMTWPQIINGQRIPTDLYGIKGIPQIILFGPDGTIIKRNLRGEEIGKTLSELIK